MGLLHSFATSCFIKCRDVSQSLSNLVMDVNGSYRLWRRQKPESFREPLTKLNAWGPHMNSISNGVDRLLRWESDHVQHLQIWTCSIGVWYLDLQLRSITSRTLQSTWFLLKQHKWEEKAKLFEQINEEKTALLDAVAEKRHKLDELTKKTAGSKCEDCPV
eukprot:Platyproteum_vivax@DN7980_c0_g1_i1.p1